MRKAYTLFTGLFLLTAAAYTQTAKKVVLDPANAHGGNYLTVEPKSQNIQGVLVLVAGFGEPAENIFTETKLHHVAYKNNILTVGFGAGPKLYADSLVRAQLTAVFKDVLKTHKVKPQNFVLGGFSAGGAVVLRYTELCNEFPDRYPISPRGVFLVDSPIDIFTTWNMLEENLKNNYSQVAVNEAKSAMDIIRNDHGVPRENVKTYAELSPFCMDRSYGQHEKFLKNTAVRTYHDVDIAWRLLNRNQTVHNSNYEVTAELINRLLLMGNTRAEFMQSFKTGYRANGQRHPHSWSIVDEAECIAWMKKLWE